MLIPLSDTLAGRITFPWLLNANTRLYHRITAGVDPAHALLTHLAEPENDDIRRPLSQVELEENKDAYLNKGSIHAQRQRKRASD